MNLKNIYCKTKTLSILIIQSDCGFSPILIDNNKIFDIDMTASGRLLLK